MFTIALSLFLACGDKSTDTAEESTNTAEDTASGTSGSYPGEEQAEGAPSDGKYALGKSEFEC